MGTQCDLYLDWHTGADGDAMTDTIAAGSCRPASPAPDAYPGTTLTKLRIEADAASPVSGLVTAGGVEYDIGDTTQGIIFDLDNLAVEEMVLGTLATAPDVVSMGFMFRTDLALEWAYWAPCGFLCSGEWAQVGIRYMTDGVRLYMHTSQGYGANYVALARNTWYWVTIQYNRTAGQAYLAVYDPATWAQFGSTVSCALGASPPVANYWCVGGQENQGNQTSASWLYGPVMVDWTDGTFPLVPEAGGGDAGVYAGEVGVSLAPSAPVADLWSDSMLKWCDEGETSLGDVYLRGQARPSLYLGLYKNSTEPGEAATMADVTEAATPGTNGYARIQLADGDWTEVVQGTFANLQKSFECATSAWGNVYGYFVTTAATGASGKLVTVEHFADGPYDVGVGDIVRVTPRVSFT